MKLKKVKARDYFGFLKGRRGWGSGIHPDKKKEEARKKCRIKEFE